MLTNSSRVWRQRHVFAAPVLAAITAVGTPGIVRVLPGDTLWGLARTHHSSVAALQQANGLHSDLIYAGALLRVPGQPADTPARPAASHDVAYRVGTGDYLIRIADRFKVSPQAIATRNRLPASRNVILGSTLLIPVTGAAAPPTRYPLSTTASAARSRAVLAGRRHPSKAYVQATIRRAAARLGVDPSLALAVSYQESGFQQHVVSPANAIGTMQVLPSTARWLSTDVVGRRLNLYDTADNVTAGVSLLHLLLRTQSTPNAVAAYYQGAGSLHRHGMYPETKAYVRSVLGLRARFH